MGLGVKAAESVGTVHQPSRAGLSRCRDRVELAGREMHGSELCAMMLGVGFQEGSGASVSAAPVGLSLQHYHLHVCVGTECFGPVLFSLKDSWGNEKSSLE